MLLMATWTFPRNHAWALLSVAYDPEMRGRDIAASLRTSERSACTHQEAGKFFPESGNLSIYG